MAQKIMDQLPRNELERYYNETHDFTLPEGPVIEEQIKKLRRK